MSNYIAADNSFLAYSTSVDWEGGSRFKPGSRRAVPKLISHSLNYAPERITENYLDGTRTASRSQKSTGTVTGDVISPLVYGGWSNAVISRVMRNNWGSAGEISKAAPNQMKPGNYQHWRLILESIAWKSSTSAIDQKFMACEPTGFTVSFSPQGTTTLSTTVLGLALNRYTSGDDAGNVIDFDKASAEVYAREGGVTTVGADYNIRLRDVETGTMLGDWCMTTAELSVQNSAEPQYCIGTNDARDIRIGSMTVGLTATIYTQVSQKRLWELYRDDKEIAFEIYLNSKTKKAGYHFVSGNCQFNSLSAPLEGADGDVMTTISLTAHTEGRNNAPLVIIKTDYRT